MVFPYAQKHLTWEGGIMVLPTPLDKTRVLFISAHQKYKLRLTQWPLLIDNVYFHGVFDCVFENDVLVGLN